MTLVDSGPLTAIYLPTDKYHDVCTEALPNLIGPMITSLACLTEALHFVGKLRGWRGQSDIWKLVADKRLEIHAFTPEDLQRMCDLMDKYSDAPLDLADASLVVLAENLNETTIFTIDSHFHGYRLRDRRALRVTPAS